MLLYLESFYGDCLLSGKLRPEKQLRRMCKWVYKHYPAAQFARMFCYLYNFEDYTCRLNSDDLKPEYWFDLDTGYFSKPMYEAAKNFWVEELNGKWAVFDRGGKNLTGYIFDSARYAAMVFE